MRNSSKNFISSFKHILLLQSKMTNNSHSLCFLFFKVQAIFVVFPFTVKRHMSFCHHCYRHNGLKFLTRFVKKFESNHE